MALRKKLRRFAAVSPKKQTGATTISTTDIWLQRISHISQFGLFLFTVGAIYFTVIPLYQKALLDEQIARKEIDLARLKRALDSAYVKIRSSVVGSYIFHAGAQCSGLMLAPDPMRTLQNHSSRQEKSYSERVLSISPVDCLSTELRTTSLKELKAEDLVFLQSEVARIGSALEQHRQTALARFAKAEETAKVGPHTMPTTGVTGAIAEYVMKGESPKFQESVLAQTAVDKERSGAASQYADEVRSEVSNLRSIRWPSDNDGGL